MRAKTRSSWSRSSNAPGSLRSPFSFAGAKHLGDFVEAHVVRLEQDQRVEEEVGGFVGDLLAVAAQGRDHQLGGFFADLLVPEGLVGEELGRSEERRVGKECRS